MLLNSWIISFLESIWKCPNCSAKFWLNKVFKSLVNNMHLFDIGIKIMTKTKVLSGKNLGDHVEIQIQSVQVTHLPSPSSSLSFFILYPSPSPPLFLYPLLIYFPPTPSSSPLKLVFLGW